MKKLRFKNKTYGYGRVPATWQGRAVMGLYVVGFVTNFYRIDNLSQPTAESIVNFVLQTLILTTFLLIVAYVTGEKPEWRRGKKKEGLKENK